MDTERLLSRSTLYRSIELSLWLVGVVLLSVWATQMLRQGPMAQQHSERFLARAHAATLETSAFDKDSQLPSIDKIDTSLWSASRIEEFHKIDADKNDTIGVLSIDTLGLSAPIFSGPSDFNLNRGLGWLDRTAPLSGGGNTAIAGHRDSFFRVLKDIEKGDAITVTTLGGKKEYLVTELQIVDPSDVSVLAPTAHNQITLITCYPFYHVGSAPERFIVTATENSPATLH
ncbi:class D sortase [Gilvimarinus xylanilyticus]|uniref:Class D sortase n=1 Tax=Gilvimarinus xylanilyticus TaxID=2944139 RepID=A0A9X2KX32_9GAMM|nr:class D sortase [Gilvimarinus xylanilyticus]MCP8900525.1 class D sortase [Gilvimarinus xylanilyticus]